MLTEWGWAKKKNGKVPARTPDALVQMLKVGATTQLSACKRVRVLLQADPSKVWTFPELHSAMPDVSDGTLRTAVATLRKTSRADTPGRGLVQDKAGAANGSLDAIEASQDDYDTRHRIADAAAPKTKNQREAYLRNLVTRMAIAVHIDLGLDKSIDSERDLEQLKRWMLYGFNMGRRDSGHQEIKL